MYIFLILLIDLLISSKFLVHTFFLYIVETLSHNNFSYLENTALTRNFLIYGENIIQKVSHIV